MRPRIKRESIDVATQAQRIIRTLAELYDRSYWEVRKYYYQFKEDIQVVKFHLNRLKYESLNQ